MRQRELRDDKSSGEVDSKGLLPALERFFEQRRTVSHAGVVDERVDAAEPLDRRADRSGSLLASCDVGGRGDRLCSALAKLVRDLLEWFCTATDECNRIAAPGEGVRSGPADAGGRSGHDRAASCRLHCG